MSTVLFYLKGGRNSCQGGFGALIREKVGISYLGACEVAQSLQARLVGLHGFYDWVPQRGGVEKIINLSEWMKSPWALKSD